jgi:hypothetical protein
VKSLREVAPYKTPTSKEKEVGTPQRTMFFAKRTPGQTKLKLNTTSEVGVQDFSNNLDADNRVEAYMLFKEISDNARRSIELMKNDPRTPQAMRDMAHKVSRGEKVATDWTGSKATSRAPTYGDKVRSFFDDAMARKKAADDDLGKRTQGWGNSRPKTEAEDPKAFHTSPHKKKKSNIDPNNYDYSTPLSEDQ